MKVRKAKLEDIGTLLELGRLMIEESPMYNRFTPNVEKQYKVFLEMILNERYLVLLLEDGSGFFVGHVTDFQWFDELVTVDDLLFVKPEVRKTSRAVKLVQAYELWAKERGAHDARLIVTTGIDVEQTCHFYEKLGYSTLGFSFYKEL